MLDGDKNIVGWKLTKSTGFDQIAELLADINERLNSKYVRASYQRIFGEDIPVKDDLFHIVQRLTSTVPEKKSSAAKNIKSEMGLIFRNIHDPESIRKESTPCSEQILNNLQYFVKENKQYIETLPEKKRQEMEKALKNAEKHIIKSCVSGIDPGHGTETNERLHRFLNYSCLSGVPKISPEVMIAIISIMFYAFNKKKENEKHACNSKVNLVHPVKRFPTFRENLATPDSNTLQLDTGCAKKGPKIEILT